jgi:hypothetical protein
MTNPPLLRLVSPAASALERYMGKVLRFAIAAMASERAAFRELHRSVSMAAVPLARSAPRQTGVVVVTGASAQDASAPLVGSAVAEAEAY